MRKVMRDEESDEELPELMDEQGGHSSTTALERYGVTRDDIASLSHDAIDGFVGVSRRWHDFLAWRKASACERRQEKKKRRRKSARLCGLGQRRMQVNTFNRLPESTAATLACLRGVYGMTAQPMSREQAYALEFVQTGSNDGIIFLPTGEGKSSLIICVAKELGGTTLLFSPLVAVKQDLSRRCATAGASDRIDLQSIENLEHVVSRYKRTSDLRRIFIDEAHLILSHANFRQFSSVKLLKSLNVPVFLLTATLPSAQESQLVDKLMMSKYHVIRADSDRPNLGYRVVRCQMLEVVDLVRGLVLAPGKRVLVYCLTVEHVQMLADALQTSRFHGKMTQEENNDVMALWNGRQMKILVCTTAFGAGVDYPLVRYFVHCGAPYDIVSYAQERGRAGRGGRRADCIIAATDEGEEEVKELITTTGCRRAVLGRAMDGVGYACIFDERKVKFDNCEEAVVRVAPLQYQADQQYHEKGGILSKTNEDFEECLVRVSDECGWWVFL